MSEKLKDRFGKEVFRRKDELKEERNLSNDEYAGIIKGLEISLETFEELSGNGKVGDLSYDIDLNSEELEEKLSEIEARLEKIDGKLEEIENTLRRLEILG